MFLVRVVFNWYIYFCIYFLSFAKAQATKQAGAEAEVNTNEEEQVGKEDAQGKSSLLLFCRIIDYIHI